MKRLVKKEKIGRHATPNGMTWHGIMKLASKEYAKCKMIERSKRILSNSVKLQLQKRIMNKYNPSMNYLVI
jgi:hypothetical protein